jgi:hypothetical protein
MCLPPSPKFEPKQFIIQPIEKKKIKIKKRVSFSIDEGYKSENSNNSSKTSTISNTSKTSTTSTKINKTIVENNNNNNNNKYKPITQNEKNGNINDMFSSSVFLLNNYKHNLDIAIDKINDLQLQLIASQAREEVLNDKYNKLLLDKYDKNNKVLRFHDNMISTQV